MVGLRGFETGLRGFGPEGRIGVQQEGGRGEVNLPPREDLTLRPKGRRISGVSLASFLNSCRMVLGSLWNHFGTNLGLFWDDIKMILRSIWDHFGIMLG